MTNERAPRPSKLGLLVAEFFYSGRFPYAPGTAGSLASLIIWIPVLYLNFSLISHILILLFLFILGLWASKHGMIYYQKSDPKQVVIDEVVGQGLPFLVISPTIYNIILAFGLFRLFDILKPWPINILDRKLKNNFGIMLDDILAGIYAMIFIVIIKKFLAAY